MSFGRDRRRFCAPIVGLHLSVLACIPGWIEPPARQVSSGLTNKPTRRWLGPDRADRIRVFGFEIGGDAKEFQQFVVFNSGRDIATVTRVVVDILYSALDYRGLER